jgi:hypothetical protein
MFTEIDFKEIKVVIDEINETIFDQNEDADIPYCVLHYYNREFYVYFLDEQIWNSDDDARKYDDDKDDFSESIREYLFKQINTILSTISKIELNL